MCTLIVLDRVVPGLPLVVASNRDEYLSRPATPPARVEPDEGNRPAFVAPQDLEQGGTWMGINARGVFVGLTNRVTEKACSDRRSRGLLVLDALRQESARAAARDMGDDLEGRYNPFHFLCADGSESFLVRLREDGATTRELEPGVHVVCNRDPDDARSTKTRRIREAVLAIDPTRPFPEVFEALRGVLGAHDGASPLEAACVHTPEYGTRSSAVLAVGPGQRCYWHAEGPACEAKYRDYSRLLDGLQ